MKIDGRPFLVVIMILALISGACATSIGGGTSASVGADSSAQGKFVADDTGVISVMSALGSIPHIGEVRYVQDNTGKRAEMSFDVINAVGSVGYSASFVPKEGMLGKAKTSVSASQKLNVAKADSITLHAAAQSAPGSNMVDVDMVAARTDPLSPASFSGSTLSQASATNTLAKIQGHVVGSIIRTAGYGGSAIGDPYTTTETGDSGGNKVDCTLLMQATSNKGIGAISGVSTFNVDVAKNEKIQSAVNAAWDRDTINIAKGTYIENVVIDKSLAVKGAGSTKTIVDGNKAGSVFTIGMNNPNADVSLSSMTIQGGSGTTESRSG